LSCPLARISELPKSQPTFKTPTLEIPDALLQRAKSTAAEQEIPLSELLFEALAEKLHVRPRKDKPWLKAFGRLCSLRKSGEL
jgi:hypothetical protein